MSTWVDTDGYSASTAGSYTFTATLETLPTGYLNSGSYNATVEVVVSATCNITRFASITNVSAGKVGSATYADAAAVITALPTTVTANTAYGTVSGVTVTTWVDTDTYNVSASGNYTFTATLGTLPTGLTNTNNYTATIVVTVESASSGSVGGGSSTTTTTNDISKTDKLISAIESSATSIKATMAEGNTAVDAKVFTALAAQTGKTLTITADNYKWIVTGVDITDPTVASSYDLGVTLKWKLLKEITTVPTGANAGDLAVELKINYSGDLPGKMTLEFGTESVDNPYDGQTLYLYYLNDTTGEYEYYGTVTVGSDGVAQIQFVHASTYLLAEKRILTDISGHWSYNNIINMVGMDIISGFDGMFYPDSNITRAEFAKMVATAFGYESSSKLTAFSDVSSSDWYYEYAAALYENGIMQGVGDRSFGANETLTREQMAAIIYRVIENRSYEIADTAAMPTFKDEAEIADFATEAVNELTSKGIINGVGNNSFSPDTFATKAQVSAILDRLIEIIGS